MNPSPYIEKVESKDRWRAWYPEVGYTIIHTDEDYNPHTDRLPEEVESRAEEFFLDELTQTEGKGLGIINSFERMKKRRELPDNLAELYVERDQYQAPADNSQELE